MSKVIELGPQQAPRLWIVFDVDGKPLQLFKGHHNDALAAAAKSYEGKRKIGACKEAVDCTLEEVQFVTTLLDAEWLVVQFGLLAQASAQVQVPQMRPGLIKH